MVRRKLAIAAGGAALVLSACGASSNPRAGSPQLRNTQHPGRAVVDDPRRRHLKCLRGLNMPVVEQGSTNLVLGAPPYQARVVYEPTPGAAQAAQIDGQIEAAEVIGSALLYPQQMPDAQLKPIEKCLAQGVKG